MESKLNISITVGYGNNDGTVVIRVRKTVPVSVCQPEFFHPISWFRHSSITDLTENLLF